MAAHRRAPPRAASVARPPVVRSLERVVGGVRRRPQAVHGFPLARSGGAAVTPRYAEELLNVLKQKGLSLDELHERTRLSGSVWSRDQLELFLVCAPGVERDDNTGTFRADAGRIGDDLQTAIIEAVRSFVGKPASAAQVRARLPNPFVTTDEQVLAVARRTVGLEVFGPKLIRIAQ